MSESLKCAPACSRWQPLGHGAQLALQLSLPGLQLTSPSLLVLSKLQLQEASVASLSCVHCLLGVDTQTIAGLGISDNLSHACRLLQVVTGFLIYDWIEQPKKQEIIKEVLSLLEQKVLDPHSGAC